MYHPNGDAHRPGVEISIQAPDSGRWRSGGQRLDKLEPEHLERFYAKMRRNGSAASTAHQVHRAIRTALNNEAFRRGHLTRNVASLGEAAPACQKKK
jgi:hypothetical protein